MGSDSFKSFFCAVTLLLLNSLWWWVLWKNSVYLLKCQSANHPCFVASPAPMCLHFVCMLYKLIEGTSDRKPSTGRKSSLRELKQLPRSKFAACWTLLLFCWRKDQNNTFFFVQMCPGCLTSLPHLPRPLESNHNPPSSCFLCQKNTSGLSLENVLLCRCALSQGGWPSLRLNAPWVSCMTVSLLSPLRND